MDAGQGPRNGRQVLAVIGPNYAVAAIIAVVAIILILQGAQ